MRVICIDASGCSLIHEGNVYTVFTSGIANGLEVYMLEDIKGQAYCQDRFVTCSDIDEMELVEEECEELA